MIQYILSIMWSANLRILHMVWLYQTNIIAHKIFHMYDSFVMDDVMSTLCCLVYSNCFTGSDGQLPKEKLSQLKQCHFSTQLRKYIRI